MLHLPDHGRNDNDYYSIFGRLLTGLLRVECYMAARSVEAAPLMPIDSSASCEVRPLKKRKDAASDHSSALGPNRSILTPPTSVPPASQTASYRCA
jgi:hypothetical protein